MVGGAAIGSVTALAAILVGSPIGLAAAASAGMTPLHILVASLVVNIAGAVAFAVLRRRWPAGAPRLYALFALVVATGATLKVVIASPSSGFAVVAGVLHYVVAVLSSVAVPWFLSDSAPLQVCAASRWLIGAGALFTAIAPLVADFNASHLENAAWPAHARYHGLLLACVMVGIGAVAITMIWRPFPAAERRLRVALATGLPAMLWLAFALVLVVPGASSWPDGAARLLPIAPNVIIGQVLVLLELIAWRLDARARRGS
jgi:hypothetical protein